MNDIRVYDTLTKALVPFRPREGNLVKWYICGPTVYDSAHLGHARAYVTFDMIRRVLEEVFQYDVFLVMNVTDIDDKIIERARERKCPFQEHARQYETMFLEDMCSLGVQKPDVLTRVSSSLIPYSDSSFRRTISHASRTSLDFVLMPNGPHLAPKLT